MLLIFSKEAEVVIYQTEVLVVEVIGGEIIARRIDSNPRDPVEVRLALVPGGIKVTATGPYTMIQDEPLPAFILVLKEEITDG